MEKTFSKFELARLKRTAQNLNQFYGKREKLNEQISKLQEELKEINSLIEITDAPTKALTGGFSTDEIIQKVVTSTIDNNGKVTKKVEYQFIYPETIIPTEQQLSLFEEETTVETNIQ